MTDFLLSAATPAEWLMVAQGMFIFSGVVLVYAWITGEW
jgi:hypothetical protein